MVNSEAITQTWRAVHPGLFILRCVSFFHENRRMVCLGISTNYNNLFIYLRATHFWSFKNMSSLLESNSKAAKKSYQGPEICIWNSCSNYFPWRSLRAQHVPLRKGTERPARSRTETLERILPETCSPPSIDVQKSRWRLVAPKAQFQLVTGCDVVDFGCPPGKYGCHIGS